jgi:hypothetical protein
VCNPFSFDTDDHKADTNTSCPSSTVNRCDWTVRPSSPWKVYRWQRTMISVTWPISKPLIIGAFHTWRTDRRRTPLSLIKDMDWPIWIGLSRFRRLGLVFEWASHSISQHTAKSNSYGNRCWVGSEELLSFTGWNDRFKEFKDHQIETVSDSESSASTARPHQISSNCHRSRLSNIPWTSSSRGYSWICSGTT